MLKSLFIGLVMVPSLAMNFTLSLGQNQAHAKTENGITVVSKGLIIDDLDEEDKSQKTSNDPLNSQDLHLGGVKRDTHFRIYIDSTGDTLLPPSPIGKSNDYLIGKGAKNTWYDHLIPGIQLDVTKYAKDKSEFLQKYRAVTFSYVFNYNFWNSKKGWTYAHGKFAPLGMEVKTYQLTGNDYDQLLFEVTDPLHSSNERVHLILKQRWVGNILTYNFYLGVWYYWKALSPIPHAAYATFTNDIHSFLFVPNDEREGIARLDEIEETSTFTLQFPRQEVLLTGVDEKVKAKAKEEGVAKANFKSIPMFAHNYYGFKLSNNIMYIFSIATRWLGISAQDSTLILNGIERSRTLVQTYLDEKFSFRYENSRGDIEQTPPAAMDPTYIGMQVNGWFRLPLIYTI